MDTTDGAAATVKTALRRSCPPLGSIMRIRSADRVVLTFDDGPDPEHTPAVLDALAAHDVHATFFVLMTRVRRFPSLLADLVDAGHEIALHGEDHRRLSTLAPREVLRRTRAARSELEDRTGRSARWTRPPYGAQTLGTWTALRRCGLMPVLWNASSADWREMDADERVHRVLDRARAGDIVLNHDAIAGADDHAEPVPVPDVDRGALVARLLDGYRSLGLRPSTLSAALTDGRSVRELRFQR